MVEKTFNFIVNGGKATGGPPIGPALGPMGVNIMAIVNKINEETAEYDGLPVPVDVVVDTDTREFSVSVGFLKELPAETRKEWAREWRKIALPRRDTLQRVCGCRSTRPPPTRVHRSEASQWSSQKSAHRSCFFRPPRKTGDRTDLAL